MKIINFTDIHNNFKGFENLGDLIQGNDLVIISGDITHFGHMQEAKKIFEFIKKFNRNILAVIGNCDYPDVNAYLETEHINLDNQALEVDGFNLIGVGGSLPCPGVTPNELTEENFKEKLELLALELNPEKQTILVVHQPPYSTVCDRVSLNNHVGSHAVRAFIEKHKPLLCLTGHIHEGIGIDSIGSTMIVNPGPFKNGHYALIEINDANYNISVELS